MSVDEGVERLESSFLADRNVKWCSHCGEQFGDSSKSEMQNYRMTQQTYSLLYTFTN